MSDPSFKGRKPRWSLRELPGMGRNHDILGTRSLWSDVVSVRVKRHRGKKHTGGKTEFSPNTQEGRASFPFTRLHHITDPACPLGDSPCWLRVSPSSQSGAFKCSFLSFFPTWWGHVGSFYKNDIAYGWFRMVGGLFSRHCPWLMQTVHGWWWVSMADPLCFKPAPPWWSRGPRFYPGNLY